MNNVGVNQETPDSEPLLIVDIHDRVIGKATKPVVHTSRQWHRQSYVFILDGRGNVLLQKRGPRRQFDPGRWTTSVSGHVTGADSYLVSAHREVREEIGVELPELMYLGKVLAYSESAGEICGGPSAVFVGMLDVAASSLNKQEAEVADVAWFSLDDIELALNSDKKLYHEGNHVTFSGDFRPVFELFVNCYKAQYEYEDRGDQGTGWSRALG